MSPAKLFRLALLWPLLLLLCGCAAQKSVQPTTPIPPGYAPDGNCIPDGFNAKTGQPSILKCTQKNGDVTIWRNPMLTVKKP